MAAQQSSLEDFVKNPPCVFRTLDRHRVLTSEVAAIKMLKVHERFRRFGSLGQSCSR